jgi:hypothetical protein
VPVRSEPDGLLTILAEATFELARNKLNAVVLERDQTEWHPASHRSAK